MTVLYRDVTFGIDYCYGDPIEVRGSTGHFLPAVLVGATKTKARVRLWKSSLGRYGSIQTVDWESITKRRGH